MSAKTVIVSTTAIVDVDVDVEVEAANIAALDEAELARVGLFKSGITTDVREIVEKMRLANAAHDLKAYLRLSEKLIDATTGKIISTDALMPPRELVA